MGKIITYLCDCCNIIYPLDELVAVQVFVFTPFVDPKMIDYEMVCPDCRQKLADYISSIWNQKEAISA